MKLLYLQKKEQETLSRICVLHAGIKENKMRKKKKFIKPLFYVTLELDTHSKRDDLQKI